MNIGVLLFSTQVVIVPLFHLVLFVVLFLSLACSTDVDQLISRTLRDMGIGISPKKVQQVHAWLKLNPWTLDSRNIVFIAPHRIALV